MIKHKNYNDSTLLDIVFSKHVPIISTPNADGSMLYSIYITKEIAEAHHYDELSYLLSNTVKETDTVNMYLSTPGGYINSAMYIIDAMTKCPAVITGILSGCVASAGTVIAMACHSLIVHSHTSMMIHNYRGGYYGAAHEIEMDFKFTHPHTQQFMRDLYDGFLTEEECNMVFSGQDKYIGADEIVQRWENVIAKRQLLQDEAEKDEVFSILPQIQEDLAIIGYEAVPISKTETKTSKTKVKPT